MRPKVSVPVESRPYVFGRFHSTRHNCTRSCVYRMVVYIPTAAALAANNTDLASFTYPAQTGIQIARGPVSPAAFINSPMASQAGIFVSISSGIRGKRQTGLERCSGDIAMFLPETPAEAHL